MQLCPMPIIARESMLSKIRPYLWLGLLSLLVGLPGLAHLPVVDRDEAHFAQATRQMLQTGHYFQIRFQDETRFQKPPGINWLQALSVHALSTADSTKIWTYRLPSLLGALLSVGFTFFFSRRFVGESVAFLAAVFLACSLLLVVETHMAVIDASLLFSVVLMQGALWVIYHATRKNLQPHVGWALLFWLAMAYGLVLKGVTPLVGLLSVAALCVMERRVAWLKGLRLVRGLLLLTLISVLWLTRLNAAEHSNYLMQMLHKDLLPKLQGSHESHGQPPLFHLFLLPITFWPASLFLWQGSVYAFRERYQPIVRFLLAWIIPTWIFFELMPTKLPQYVLPTFPAIAMLCALGIYALPPRGRAGRWLSMAQGGWGLLSVGLALSLCSLPYLLMSDWFLSGILLVFGVSVVSTGCIYFVRQGQYRLASVGVVLLAMITYPLIFSSILPQLKPLWISRNVAQLVQDAPFSEQNPLVVVGYAEPSLVFYLNTKQVVFVNNINAAAVIRQQTKALSLFPRLVETQESHCQPVRLLADVESVPQLMHDLPNLMVLARTTGYNYNKGRWVNLVLLCQKNDETKENT